MTRTSDHRDQERAQTRVNVIFVGGTVHGLLPCLESLIANTTWPLRLVLNGCADDERGALESQQAMHPDRIELSTPEPDTKLGHAETLTRLLAAERSPYFSFIDSDIVAKSPTDLCALLPESAEVQFSSCLPMWMRPGDDVLPDSHQIVDGQYTVTSHGVNLGCTFAATYHTEHVREICQEWGISFHPSGWDQLSPAVKVELERHQMDRAFYDTAKLVNLFLDFSGRPVLHRPTPSLVHFGSLSGVGLAPSHARGGTTLVGRLGHFTRCHLQGVYRIWAVLVRRLGWNEAARISSAYRRKYETYEMYLALQGDNPSFDDMPDWFGDRESFDELARSLGPKRRVR